MAKEDNLFITFLKSFSLYIIFILLNGIGTSILAKSVYLKEYTDIIAGIIFLVLIFSIYRKKIKEFFKNFIKDFKSNWLKVLLISAILIGLEIAIYQLLLHFGISSGNQDIAKQDIINSPISKIIYYILIGTIVEECCFRLPYAYCNNKNKLVTYIFYSIVFASVHLLMTTSLVGLLYIIPYLLLSFGIGYGFYKTNNLLMSTIVHIINNCLGIMLILL